MKLFHIFSHIFILTKRNLVPFIFLFFSLSLSQKTAENTVKISLSLSLSPSPSFTSFPKYSQQPNGRQSQNESHRARLNCINFSWSQFPFPKTKKSRKQLKPHHFFPHISQFLSNQSAPNPTINHPVFTLCKFLQFSLPLNQSRPHPFVPHLFPKSRSNQTEPNATINHPVLALIV